MSRTLIELTEKDVSKKKWKELIEIAAEEGQLPEGEKERLTHIRVDIYDMWTTNQLELTGIRLTK